MRARVAKDLVAKTDEFWRSRAVRQIRLTTYRLVFRDFFYTNGKKQLPLPPENLWEIKLLRAPTRQTYRGHDVVAVDYRFSSVLLTDIASPGVSEPTLGKIGGVWREPFVFPIDPELVRQRTGFACMDETDFPFPSLDSEEVDSFYDQDCKVEDGLSNKDQCHDTRQPKQSCAAALTDHVGRVDTAVRFERLAWDPSLADKYRYGKVTGDEPDLAIYTPEFTPSRVIYRYIPSSSCEVVEKAVGGTGWRRLLLFTTSDENVGNRPLTIGGVDYRISGKAGELDSHNLFEFSPCHKHYHFKYYGDFTWRGTGTIVNSKKGFCLQSTQRVANREGSPLHEPFSTCNHQGMAAGWIDQYKAGIPSQFLDTTDLAAGKGKRSFRSNRLGFLCEGTFVDAAGKPLKSNQPVVWAPTGLIADNGKPVEAPRCKLKRSWDANNQDTIDAVIPAFGEGLITEPCSRGQIGPMRNCGFAKRPRISNCRAGQSTVVTLSIPKGSSPQVVRITDYSQVLRSPIPARYEDSYVPLAPGVSDQPYMLANQIVTADARTKLTFACPGPRTGGEHEPGGTYSIYVAPVFPGDRPVAVSTV